MMAQFYFHTVGFHPFFLDDMAPDNHIPCLGSVQASLMEIIFPYYDYAFSKPDHTPIF